MRGRGAAGSGGGRAYKHSINLSTSHALATLGEELAKLKNKTTRETRSNQNGARRAER
jgi:hypothetical protein